jgi:predicted transcriptional regulator
VTGETQLRARRTRIKILRAIAEKNGSAGFSDIRNATSLSTGSIYYHLERMRNYINKASKHYVITKEGLQLLHEIDTKHSYYSSYKKNERPSSSPEIQSEGTIRQTAV